MTCDDCNISGLFNVNGFGIFLKGKKGGGGEKEKASIPSSRYFFKKISDAPGEIMFVPKKN